MITDKAQKHECQINTHQVKCQESNKIHIKINDTYLMICIITVIAPPNGKRGKRQIFTNLSNQLALMANHLLQSCSTS